MRAHPRLAGTRALFEVHKGNLVLLDGLLRGFRTGKDSLHLAEERGIPEPVILLLLAEARRRERERAGA